MPIDKFIFFILLLIILLSGFSAIGLLFYIGKTRIKDIDKAVLGYEFPHDSVFALGLRVPNYAGGFMWKWSARRGHLEGKIEHFDSQFRRPFIAFMVLEITAIVSLIAAILMDKFLLS